MILSTKIHLHFWNWNNSYVVSGKSMVQPLKIREFQFNFSESVKDGLIRVDRICDDLRLRIW